MPNPISHQRERQLAALSYLWIFAPIMLIAHKEKQFIQHHARRGLILFILSILLWIIPPLRYGEFIVLALMILGFISASLGNENTFPFLSEIADGNLTTSKLKYYTEQGKKEALNMLDKQQFNITSKAEDIYLADLYKRVGDLEARIEKVENEK